MEVSRKPLVQLITPYCRNEKITIMYARPKTALAGTAQSVPDATHAGQTSACTEGTAAVTCTASAITTAHTANVHAVSVMGDVGYAAMIGLVQTP